MKGSCKLSVNFHTNITMEKNWALWGQVQRQVWKSLARAGEGAWENAGRLRLRDRRTVRTAQVQAGSPASQRETSVGEDP